MTHQPEAWMDDAVCATVATELFFPVKGETSHAAKQLCASCPVATACLEYALRFDQPGIFAGTNQRERQEMLKEAVA